MDIEQLKDYYLIRCYQKPEHRAGFNSGTNIHMNSMNYFFSLESEFQKDTEGLVFQQAPNTKGFLFAAPPDMREQLLHEGYLVESGGQTVISDSVSKEELIRFFLGAAVPVAVTESLNVAIGGYILCFYLIPKQNVHFLEKKMEFRTDSEKDNFIYFLLKYAEKNGIAYGSVYEAYSFVNMFCAGMSQRGYEIIFHPVLYEDIPIEKKIAWFREQKYEQIVFTKKKRFEYQKEFRIFLQNKHKAGREFVEENGIDVTPTIVTEFVYLSPEYARNIMGNKA